jgi:hypothetical protein
VNTKRFIKNYISVLTVTGHLSTMWYLFACLDSHSTDWRTFTPWCRMIQLSSTQRSASTADKESMRRYANKDILRAVCWRRTGCALHSLYKLAWWQGRRGSVVGYGRHLIPKIPRWPYCCCVSSWAWLVLRNTQADFLLS